jgi:hypothetical protein
MVRPILSAIASNASRACVALRRQTRICQLDEELAAGFPIVLTLIHWPEPGVHL